MDSSDKIIELNNGQILELFRKTKEASFPKFLDNYEYVYEVLGRNNKCYLSESDLSSIQLLHTVVT